jgi:hypothetical protein
MVSKYVARFVFVFVFAAAVGGRASAADVKASALKDGRVVVSISGEIVPGDADTFKAAVKVANDAGKLVSSIRLNSIGGNLVEGVRLAEAVRFGKIITNVGQNATCASACFLIFAAGEAKYANYTARIGVHGASDKGEETVQSGAATVSMARVAKELGVPPAIIGRMVVTPPSEMVWLSPSDLQSMGTSMVGKPVQIAPPSSASVPAAEIQAGLPMQLQSMAKASAPASWESMMLGAIQISSAQNGGNAKTSRSCQPKARVCTTGVIMKMDGVETVLLQRQNPEGKIIERELCTFNSFGDIRTCTDWDTKATHRDMKDSSGEWTKVADQ